MYTAVAQDGKMEIQVKIKSVAHSPAVGSFLEGGSLCARSNEYQMVPTSPLSVGGGVFEFGFSSSSVLFSGPGSLAE